MPFLSEDQRRFMWANHPEIAKRWADKYGGVQPNIKNAAKKRLLKKKGRHHASGK